MPNTDTVVSEIKRPELTSCRRSAVGSFREAYEEHKRRIGDVNRNRAARDQLRVASIRECIKPDLLESMCVMGKIPGATTSEQLTNEMVINWYNSLLEIDPAEANSRLNEVMKTIVHKPDPTDPAGAVVDYVSEVVTKVRQLGMSGIFSDERQSRQLITKMAHGLKPIQLKDRIMKERVMWRKDDDGKIAYFSQRAEHLAKEVQNNETVKTSVASEERRTPKNNRHTHRPDRGGADKSNRHNNNRNPNGANNQGLKRNHNTPRTWTKKCLNKDNCTGVHRIQDCPNTSESEKKRLLDEYMKNRN